MLPILTQRRWQNAAATFLVLLLGVVGTTESLHGQSVTLSHWNLDACYALSNDPSSTTYTEFTPSYPSTGGFASVNSTIVSRNSGSHSCAYPRSGSGKAMCVGAVTGSSFTDNSASAVRFSTTLTSGTGTGRLATLNFWELAPTHYSWFGGASGTNNYPRRFGIRVLKNGIEVFKQVDISTQQSWNQRIIDFSTDPDFTFTGTATFVFELLPYHLVGNGASVAAWDLDDITLTGYNTAAPTGTLTYNAPSNITVAAPVGQTSAIVTFNAPSANTTCSAGQNVSMTQTAGPASGQAFAVGTTQICFRASDACGNSQERCFSVIVNATQPQADCSGINIGSAAGNVSIGGLATAPVISVQVFDASWSTVFNQFYTTNPGSVNIPGLASGQYFVKVQYLNAAWSELCKKEQFVQVTGAQPAPSASVSAVSVPENGGSATVTVSLSAPSAQPVTIQYTTSNGTATSPADYTPASGTVTIPAGSTSATFTVGIIDDNTNEPTESFNVTISNPTNAAVGTGTASVTITDNDAPGGGGSGDCNSVVVTPGSGNITITGINTPISAVIVADGQFNQVFNQFYSAAPGTVTVPNLSNGQYFVKVVYLTSSFTEICAVENFYTVGGSVGTTPSASVANITVPENGGLATVTVTISAPSAQPVTVQYATSNGSATSPTDFTPASGTVTIPAGSTTATFTVGIVDDNINEPTESFNVTLSNPINATLGTGTATVTITDNDTAPSVDCNGITITPGNGNITISGVSSQFSVIQVSDPGWNQIFNQYYSSAPGTVTIPNLSGGQYFVKVQFINQQWSEICKKDGFFTVTGGGPAQPTVSVTSATIPENGGNATVTVSLSAPSAQPVTVQYATSNGSATSPADYTPASGNVTIPAGSTSATFTVGIIDDNTNEPTESFNVTISNPTNATIGNGTASVTITDNDAAPGANCDAVVVNGGNGNITVNNAAAPVVSVQVFNSAWNTVFNQVFNNNNAPIVIPSLTAGAYNVKVDFYTAGWQTICTKQFTATVIGGAPVGVLTFTQPTNVTALAPVGATSTSVTFPTPSATSTCMVGNVSVSQIAGPVSGSQFSIGTTQVCFRATDGCGKQTDRCFNVIVNATTPSGTLTFNAPANVTVSAPVGGTGAVVNYPTPSATSTCTIGSVTVSRISGPASGSSFAIGTTQVCFRATDGCGNQTDRCFNVIVNATTPSGTLTFNAPTNVTVSAPVGGTGAVVNYPTPSATSTCIIGSVTVSLISGPASGSTFAIGTTQVCFRATDGCGNQTDRCFNVVVNAAANPCASSSIVAGWNLNGCNASGTSNSNSFSEFGGVVYSSNVANLTTTDFSVTNGSHSCTAGFAGNAACIGASSATTYSTKR